MAAVGRISGPGDERSVLGEQSRDHRGDLVGPAEPPERRFELPRVVGHSGERGGDDAGLSVGYPAVSVSRGPIRSR